MRTIVTTLNAKYIHRSLALRLLYIANRQNNDISFLEFNINDQLEEITAKILAGNPAIVAIGVYIWNVDEVALLIKKLRQIRQDLIIVIGGPEVTYQPEFFLDQWAIDYVISGEGEFVLGELLSAIESGEKINIAGVSSVGNIRKEVVQADLSRIAELPSPYSLAEDEKDMENQIIYIETSRGCPYQCQYCLSSLEKGVRYFPQKYIFDNLRLLVNSRAKQLKFLDRTFNLNKDHTKSIFDFLLANFRDDLSCQFEIYADILTDDFIEYLNRELPQNYFRFEIGIQSTHEPTNQEVKRKQDFALLSRNINHLMMGGKVDLHLDLIAGLPYETLPLFIKSFNDVFAFKAQELQLGFLKLLRGTGLRESAEFHGYKYNVAAPYEVTSNNYISREELEIISRAESALEKFWNSGRFKRSMEAIFKERYFGRYFEFFDELGSFCLENNLPHRGYQLEELFKVLNVFLTAQGLNLTPLLKLDYYDCFPQRPNNSFTSRIDKKMRRRITNQIMEDRDFLEQNNLTAQQVRKHSELDMIADNQVQITVFSGTRGQNRQLRYLID